MPDRLTPEDHIRLWNEFRSGSRPAFSQLYDLFSADLYRYGYNLVRNRQVVEDGLHELFVHLHENRQRLGATNNIRFYLYRALRRRLLDTVERSNRFTSDDYIFDRADFQVLPFENQLVDEQVAQHQSQLLVVELNKLPKRQKEVLYLVYMKGLTYAQTAEVMGITVKSIYNTMNVALMTLRTFLRESFEKNGAYWSLLIAFWNP